jgi:4-amino-4-deoxy-L-arabinose transferase-like glycosyltransferase
VSDAPIARAAPARVDTPSARAAPVPAPGVRTALARVPAAAWMCALIALLNACTWSIITPPFQGRDEVDHFAYVAQLVERGTLPANGHAEGVYSPEEKLVLSALHYYEVRFTANAHPISSIAEQRALRKALDANASLVGPGEAGVATSEPPLYYALQTIPYVLARGDVLAQLQLMRLLSAFLGALTTLLAYFFLREALPRAPWTATVGALCIALQPLFAFMSGSVNPDTLLFTISAAILLCLARAFRRGVTPRLAVALGLLIAAGFVTKLNFAGFAAGVYVGLAIFAARAARARRVRALSWIALAAALGVAPVVLYTLRNALSGHTVFGSVPPIVAHSPFDELSYIWQLYLPRLPGMPRYFAGIATYKDIWFDRSVGLYGWMDTTFPGWVDTVALVLAAVVVLLCCRELLARRDALRARLAELGTYAAIAFGILVMLGVSSYNSDVIGQVYALGEPRYLLPMLPLFGAVIVLAVRGGRRWAPVVGAAMITLLLAHDLFSQLQAIARYYG